jgi:phosphotransferase system HPr-like phosphotransfer protein
MLPAKVSRKIAKELVNVYSNGGDYDDSVREMEFLKIRRTETGYQTRLIDGHKGVDGKYTWVGLDLNNFPVEELRPIVQNISIGDNVIFCLKGKNVSEIIRKRNAYLDSGNQPQAQQEVKAVLRQEQVTEDYLRSHPFEIVGDDSSGYLVGFEILSKIGLHFRPAGEIITIAKKYNCVVNLKNIVEGKERVGTTMSILSLVSLEATPGSKLIIQSSGASKACLEEIVARAKVGFGEI